MKVTEFFDRLKIFDSPGARSKWIATGAVKINGVKVSLGDDINPDEVNSIQVGNKIKLERDIKRVH